MKHYKLLKDVKHSKCYKKRTKRSVLTSDVIYSFDIEVSNMFYINNEWRTFDKSISKDDYRKINKCSLPYIWQFGINDDVYYGRDFMEFEEVLKTISDLAIHKIIWVHNLSYEFQFLLNIFIGKYTIENMCCRDVRKPICFSVKELNIEFRCTYMLTNMSLKYAALEFTDVEKLDTLNYDDKIRTPLTKLTDDEKRYCEYDIICVYKIVKHFKEQYKHLCLIPLTSTGIVRTEFKKQVDYFYIRKMQDLVPDMNTYLRLWACFSGGYTHTNIINSNRVFKNVKSKDIASSYPYTMCCEKLPSKPFIKCPNSKFNTNKNLGYIALVRFYGLKHKMYNHYMQVSKCIDGVDIVNDNGRVCSGTASMWLTNIDFDLIQECYHMDHYEVLECYSSYLDYLDERIIKFILKLYGNKTKLKGIKEKEVVYKRDKSMLNSLY